MIATRTEAIRRLVRESISEGKKVNWPDQETTRNLTVVVIAISVVLGLFLGGIDYILVQLLNVF
jgi:preprotein translocase subunit SecE